MVRKPRAAILGLIISTVAASASMLFGSAGPGAAQIDVAAETSEVSGVAPAWRAPTEPMRLRPTTSSGLLPAPSSTQIAGGLLLAAGAAELVLVRRRHAVSLDLGPAS